MTPPLILAGDYRSDVGVFKRWGRLDETPAAGGTPPPVAGDATKLAVVGSSTFAGMADQFTSYSGARSMSLVNAANGGILAEHMLARWGSRPMTADAFTVPASGATTFTSPNVSSALFNGFSMAGYFEGFADAPGTVSKVTGGAAAAWTFTRTGTGTARSIPAGTPFVPSLGASGRNGVVLLNIGKNNLSGGVDGGTTDVNSLIAWTHAAYDYVNTADKRVLIVGHYQDTNTATTSTARTAIDTYNAAMAARYGDQFIDLSAYVTGEDVWTDTGITPTATDLSQQAAGNKPPSLSEYDAGVLDPLHLNMATKTAVMDRLIGPRLVERGWVSELAYDLVSYFDSAVRRPSFVRAYAGVGFVAPAPTVAYDPAGTGEVTISASNTTIRDRIFRYRVKVTGSNVTFINCEFQGRGFAAAENGQIVDTSSGHNTVLSHCTVYSWDAAVNKTLMYGINGVGTKNVITEWCNIHHAVDGVRTNGTGVTNDAIQYGSTCDWIHDILLQTPDLAYAGDRDDNKTHSEPWQLENGVNCYMRYSVLDGFHSTDGSSNVTTTTSTGVVPGTVTHRQSTGCLQVTNQGCAGLELTGVLFNGGEININGADKLTNARLVDCLFQDNSSFLTGSNNTIINPYSYVWTTKTNNKRAVAGTAV